ncbi:hypothetical protein BC567DRAFT_213095 [Phyllosticta citribraziliensis]
MDDLRIGFVSLDVAAPPTEDVDAEPHRHAPAQSIPFILVEDTSPDSHPLIEEEGSKNKVFIYLAGNKKKQGFVRLVGAIDSHFTQQLAEQVAAEVKKPKFLNDKQKAQLKKIVVQRYSADIASVHFFGSNKSLLIARDIPLNISKAYSEDGEEKPEASTVDAHH